MILSFYFHLFIITMITLVTIFNIIHILSINYNINQILKNIEIIIKCRDDLQKGVQNLIKEKKSSNTMQR